ncbi:MAG: SDR family oxidoreductase [Mucilaginibacter sp.]|uniref:SDR family oxidoreductase n=1 Tax=Mucilaginibacter sp. TaxID=1882438 RepID=UPI0031A59173
MKVFITGATGFVGSAVVKELIGAGHQVLGLARSEESAKKLIEAGAEVQRGDLEDLESLRNGALASDGVIHAGFLHDFSRFAEVCQIDKIAIETIGNTLVGTNKPFLVTSGTALIKPGILATENMESQHDLTKFPRVSEDAGLIFVNKGVRAMAIRLSPSVHGEGDQHGFVPIFIATAREKGKSAYIGNGENRWNAVHRLDAAHLYRLALENGVAGARYHAVADESITVKSISEAIAQHLDIPLMAITAEEAPAHFGWFANFAGIDCPASSQLTRSQLNWRPKHPSLREDLASGIYFK